MPGFRPGRAPRQLVDQAVQEAGLRAGQVVAADGVAGADRRGLQARPDHPAAARRRGDRVAGRRPDELRDGRRGPAAVRPCRTTRGLTLKRPVRPISEADIETQLTAVPRAVRPDRAQARRGRRARRLHHGRPGVLPPGRQRAQRGQGDPVPPPAGDAVPGRRDPESGRVAGRGQAGRDARGRGQAGNRRRASPPCGARPCRWTSGSTTSSRCGFPSSTRRS